MDYTTVAMGDDSDQECVCLESGEEGDMAVDQTPLQVMMQTNKESLEKKLLARRPMNTLVEQGIMPQYKTSPSLHLQKTKLERAKMSDMLKSRISHRPDRSELVHRHILEDARPSVDPSLCDRQRQLKRAKLADSLASQLSHRPGPLELIQKNILHTDDPVEQAVKEGAIQFRPTADGAPAKPEPFTFEEDSNDNTHSPRLDTVSPPQLSPEPLPANISALLAQFKDSTNPSRSVRSESLGDINVNVNQYLSQMNLGTSNKLNRSDSFGGSLTNHRSPTPKDLSCQQVGPDGKERKKLKAKSVSKPKMAPKPKTIKFHEYKGPQASLKRKKSCKKSAEQTAYELLLEQQQLFLQWQVENRNKFQQILLPAPSKGEASGRASAVSTNASSSGYISGASSSQASSILTSPSSSVPGTPRSTTPRPHTPTRASILTPQDVNNATSLLNRIEGMKVSELKQELKKVNLPVSGSKPALVERLKPALESIIAAGRQQFQQPYKQITIPNGGLIILKPSPNSQLVAENEYADEIICDNAFKQGVTPERGSEFTDYFMQKLLNPTTPDATIDNNHHHRSNTSKFGTIQKKNQRQSGSLPEFEQNFDFMDIEQQSCMPPPAPPPPPPPPSKHKKHNDLKPKPLPQPPILHPSTSQLQPPNQFLPPQQTSQQIQLAKAQLETQLADNNHVLKGGDMPRCGPRGQYIWPPVNVESSQGILTTVRAINGSQTQPTSSISCTGVNNIQLPSEPVPASELGLMLPQFLGTEKIEKHSTNICERNLSVSEEKNKIEIADTEYQKLPATLPSPENDRSAKILNNNVTSFVNFEEVEKSIKPDTEYIIHQQQRKIIELQRALEMSEMSKPQVESKELQHPDPVKARATQSNAKQLLAQQIQNKQLANKVAQLQAKDMNQFRDGEGANNTHQGQINDINVLFETLMQKPAVPESVEHFGETENKLANPHQASQQRTVESNQLDFDFGLLPEFRTIPNNITQPSGQENMDVEFDLDVQEWLDSLVVPNNVKIIPD